MAGVKGRSGGKNRKPPGLHLVEGTFRTDRHGSEEAARQELARRRGAPVPRPPRWLPRAARAEWGRLAPRLHRAGALTPRHRAAFAAYCLAVAELEDAERAIAYDLREARAALEAPPPRPEASPEVREQHQEALRVARRIVGHSARMMPGKDPGTWVRNPAVVTAAHAARRIRDFANEFGLTAQAEGRLDCKPEPEGGRAGLVYPAELDDAEGS